MNTTGWLKGLSVTADGTGIVSHAGLALLRALADFFGFLRERIASARKYAAAGRDYALFRTLYLAGLRADEAAMLDRSDAHFGRGPFGKLHVRFGKGAKTSGPVADLGGVTRQGKKGLSRFVSVNAAPAPTPAVPPRPQGDLTRASIEEIAQAVRTTWPTKSADNRWRRSRGARDLLEHLSEFPGQTWQDRDDLSSHGIVPSTRRD